MPFLAACIEKEVIGKKGQDKEQAISQTG